MATDHPWRSEPIDLAPEVVLLAGFDGDAADPFLVPVNALLLGRGDRLLVIPGARRAPWAPALAGLAEQVRWIVSARPSVTPDLRLALAHCRRATPLDAAPPRSNQTASNNTAPDQPDSPDLTGPGHADGPSLSRHRFTLSAGRFALVDPPTTPVRSRAVLDTRRRVLFSADAFGAPVLLPATDAADLDDGYWRHATTLHAQWAGHDATAAAALTGRGLELIVPAFGPVLRAEHLDAALTGLRTDNPCSPLSGAGATYAARMEELTAGEC